VANTLKLYRNGAVGFIGWLDGWRVITRVVTNGAVQSMHSVRDEANAKEATRRGKHPEKHWITFWRDDLRMKPSVQRPTGEHVMRPKIEKHEACHDPTREVHDLAAS
jgi:hypothetical protein